MNKFFSHMTPLTDEIYDYDTENENELSTIEKIFSNITPLSDEIEDYDTEDENEVSLTKNVPSFINTVSSYASTFTSFIDQNELKIEEANKSKVFSEEDHESIIGEMKDKDMRTHAAVKQLISQRHEKKSQVKQKTYRPKTFFDKNQNFRCISTVKSSPIYRKSRNATLYLENWEMTLEQRSYFNNHSSSDNEESSFVQRRHPKRNSITNAVA